MNNQTLNSPILITRNLNKSFGGVNASSDVCLDLQTGEIHALIGPNGAGKSTLVKQIVGEVTPDSGTVEFCGQDVTDLSTPRRARLGMGRTFQISSLIMEYTVLQNTLLGALGQQGNIFRFFKPAMKDPGLLESAHKALQQVGLEDFKDFTTSELSHGQRRQLEVAVALTLKPKAFLMDEPMAGLGLEGSKRLVDFLDGLRRQAPILLVEHDMDAVFALADRISVLVNGKIIASGSVDEIRQNEEVRQAYLGEEVNYELA